MFKCFYPRVSDCGKVRMIISKFKEAYVNDQKCIY